MAKKADPGFGSGALEQTRDLSQAIVKSSHRIWLAGLGAFARAQDEGTKVFDTLVAHGERLESTTRQAATEAANAARGAATAKAKEMQELAGGTWDRLEQVFEDRVARALAKLGVHTQNDVQKLSARVDELAAAVKALVAAGVPAKAKKTPGAPKKRGPRATTRKSAARKRTG